jgi:hypothetical protein
MNPEYTIATIFKIKSRTYDSRYLLSFEYEDLLNKCMHQIVNVEELDFVQCPSGGWTFPIHKLHLIQELFESISSEVYDPKKHQELIDIRRG